MEDFFDGFRQAISALSKEELIDIIMEKVNDHGDYNFRVVIENKMSVKENSPETIIENYRTGIANEMSCRVPDSFVIESLTRTMMKDMEKWGIYDTVAGCIEIIQLLDDALCNGAGMEDEEDFSISCDIETAAEYAAKRIREQAGFDNEEYAKLAALLREYSSWEPGVMCRDVVEDIVNALD